MIDNTMLARALMGQQQAPMGEVLGGGQQVAQSSPIQMRPIGNGQVQVINIQTGQVLYTGSAAGAANAQANGALQRRRLIE